MRARALCLALSALLASACGPILVEEGTPAPRIALPPSRVSLALELLPGVTDRLEIPWGQNGLRAITVTRFRTTLRNGFVHGVAPLFARPSLDAPAEWVVQIAEATPEFVAAQVTPMFGVTRVSAQIRYQARLVDQTSRELRRTTGTAVGPRQAGSVDDMGDALDSAVEQLYQKLARELLAAP